METLGNTHFGKIDMVLLMENGQIKFMIEV